MSGAVIELVGVHKAYGEVQAVVGIDLVAPAGAVTVLLGPSGSGKTSALRLVGGFEVPDAGEVRIAGETVAGAGRWVPPERRRVGMVFQQLALFPHLDVAGNVGYGLRGLDRRARAARVGELLALVGLTGYERRYPDELSGGQAQRVALARALAPRPRVVLLDEPFSSLDVTLRAELRVEVRRILAAEGVTSLLVTHDQAEALALGDQVAVMFDGRIAQIDRPEVVYRTPATPEVAAFLGDANLVAGEVRGGSFSTELGTIGVVADVADGPAFGLVRPEDLDLVERPGARARVIDVDYYGHDQLITVSMPSGGELKVRLHARHRFAVGAPVAVSLDEAAVVVFPRPRSGDHDASLSWSAERVGNLP
jgi:iron(III) transport system ATP-binding protein